jgi:hypothetical protein
MDLDPNKRPVARDIIGRLNEMTSDTVYSIYETSISSSSVELQVSLPREQSGEKIKKIATESLEKVDVKEHPEISDDFVEPVGKLHLQESQQKLGQISLSGAQDTEKKVNRPGASISRSISSVFFKLRNLDIFKRKERMPVHRNYNHVSDNVKIFRMKELEPIIRDSNLIGKGDFTEVYKGVLADALVVVKKPISSYGINNWVFEREVGILSQMVHKNIVRFIGCCLEMDSPILVHEFISRGSLDDILHRVDNEPLNIDVRLTIVAESAQGLAYMHSGAGFTVIHGNVKPANILLCENFVPKISGFFISRLVQRNDEFTAHMFGNLIYTDPVYIQTYLLTEKSDVYSFGVVILEVISRKKASIHSDYKSLVRSFLEVHEKGNKATELFDKEIAVTTGDLEILDSLAEIAVECLNLDVDRRPKMADVAERLLTLQRYHRSQIVRR